MGGDWGGFGRVVAEKRRVLQQYYFSRKEKDESYGPRLVYKR